MIIIPSIVFTDLQVCVSLDRAQPEIDSAKLGKY